jgi:hypothetical protein
MISSNLCTEIVVYVSLIIHRHQPILGAGSEARYHGTELVQSWGLHLQARLCHCNITSRKC